MIESKKTHHRLEKNQEENGMGTHVDLDMKYVCQIPPVCGTRCARYFTKAEKHYINFTEPPLSALTFSISRLQSCLVLRLAAMYTQYARLSVYLGLGRRRGNEDDAYGWN